jgi:hypothetical protein
MRTILRTLKVWNVRPALFVTASLAIATLVVSTPADAQRWGWRGAGIGYGRIGSGLGWRPGLGVGRAGLGWAGWRNGVGYGYGRLGYRGYRYGYGYGAAALAGAGLYAAASYPYYGSGYGYPYGGYSGLYSYYSPASYYSGYGSGLYNYSSYNCR